jgi:hypothetical protein
LVENGIYSFPGVWIWGKFCSVGFAGALEIYLPSTGRELPVKQAHIEPKQAKEELKPFLQRKFAANRESF